MRSLVSDLIPEYNKKLQFFLKRHWLMLWNPPTLPSLLPSPTRLPPLSALVPPAHVYTINMEPYRNPVYTLILPYGNFNPVFVTLCCLLKNIE